MKSIPEEQEREAFEAAMAKEGYELSPQLYRDGTYRAEHYAAAWEMWKARASLAERQDSQALPEPSDKWRLIAPNGREWSGDSPIKACREEQRSRIPDGVAYARIMEMAEQPIDRNLDGAAEFVRAIVMNQPIWPNMWGQDVAAAAFFLTDNGKRATATPSPTQAAEMLSALRIADAFCGSLTSDVCPDDVHIPIRNAIAKATQAAPVQPSERVILRCGDCKAPLNDDFGCDTCGGPEDAAPQAAEAPDWLIDKVIDQTDWHEPPGEGERADLRALVRRCFAAAAIGPAGMDMEKRWDEAAEARKPLTVEQIKACEAEATKPLRTGDIWTPHQVRFVRAIEAAHGIGSQP